MALCGDIEAVQEYWDNRPCNIRHSNKSFGSREYFDDIRSRKYFVERHIPSFAGFSNWYGKKVLEIGCGIGTDTMEFARNGAEVTAVDLSEWSLKVAKKRAKIYGTKVRFIHANAENPLEMLKGETFDLIYSFGVIHHTPKPWELLKSIRPLMHDDSVLKIMLYHKYSWKVLWILLKYGKGAFWKFEDLVARYSEAQTGCPVTRAYSKRSARHLLLGYKILDMKVDHIFPFKIPEYTKYMYKKVWYFRCMPSFLFRLLEKTIGWHLLITAKKT